MPSRFPLVHSSVKSRALKGLCLRANEGALSRGPPALLVFLFFSSFDEAAYTFPPPSRPPYYYIDSPSIGKCLSARHTRTCREPGGRGGQSSGAARARS